MRKKKGSPGRWVLLFLCLIESYHPATSAGAPAALNPQADLAKVEARIRSEGELAPLPEAKPLLTELAEALESNGLNAAIQGSRSLEILKNRLKTSLFHLNLNFDVVVKDYPYDPPFKEPFPFRPTLETIEEASRFLETVEKTTGFKSDLIERLRSFPHFRNLTALFSARPEVKQTLPRRIPKSRIIAKPVDSYIEMQARLERFGETASFPEFKSEVNRVLQELSSPEVKAYAANDKVFAAEVDSAKSALQSLNARRGAATNLQKGFETPFPYRRTIQTLEQGLAALDLKERLKYPETENWHEVEKSWYRGEQPKLRPMYHFNRYKYQMSGLLANPQVVLLPFDAISMEDLLRLRAAPWGLLGATVQTVRVDRFHHTPLEEWYHDVNHVRRMWGYDKRKQQKLGIGTREERIAIYREQESFIHSLLARTAPTTRDAIKNEIRKQQRVTIFESFHETALTPDRDSLLKDLQRKPNTPQPFELQVQAPIEDLEKIRTFDGNLKSGADKLPLDLKKPTTIRYFYDRAPGFLTNVDNKLRWGFYDSVFAIDESLGKLEFRTPEFLARSSADLMKMLGQPPTESRAVRVKQIYDRTGQPELYNYYGIDSPEAGNRIQDEVLAVGVLNCQEKFRKLKPPSP